MRTIGFFFIEVMGRDAGFIALRAGVATGAEAVLIPESETRMDDLIEALIHNFENKKDLQYCHRRRGR